MRNLSILLICILFYSCQVLDERVVTLNSTFCEKCEKPLKEILLKDKAIYVVKFDEKYMTYNYDKELIDIDSLENELMNKGFLPRNDSIIMYPVCCSKGSKIDTVIISELIEKRNQQVHIEKKKFSKPIKIKDKNPNDSIFKDTF